MMKMATYLFCVVAWCCLLVGQVLSERRFIVTGSGNTVDGNTISHNENTYNNGSSSSGGATGGGSSSTSGGSSGGGTTGSPSGGSGGGWAVSCHYYGKTHKPGDVFSSWDGCNNCTCSPLGAACTTDPCSGKRNIQRRFIVTGSGNTVDGNTISNNENTYNNGSSSSGGATGGGSSSTSGGSSGGGTTGSPSGGSGGGWAVSCHYYGKTHKPGDVFPSWDGCNNCTCSPLGAACTTDPCSGKRNIRTEQKRFIVDGDNNHVDNNKITDNENTYNSGGSSGSSTSAPSGTTTASMGIGPPGGSSSGATCTYQGTTHNHGVVWQAPDGCNKCTCTPLGAACTQHFCSGKREARTEQKRFIVDGDNNHVDNNKITDNENTYNSGGSSGSSTSAPSGTTTASMGIGPPGGSSSGATCTYQGTTHNHGVVWQAPDGCNKCTCTPLGAACTQHFCSGKREARTEQKRFIVDGDNNHVDNNKITDNENTYNSGGSSGSSTSAPSGTTTASMGIGPPGGSSSGGTGKKRFIVDGSNNTVDHNTITDNENTYNSGGSSGGSTGAPSGTTKSSSGGSSSGATCTYQGTTHNHGVVWQAPDGCNKCTCTPLGAACTQHFCSGKRDARRIARRFIVDGSNNHVSNNQIVDNENVYGPGSGRHSTSGSVATQSPSNAQGQSVCAYNGGIYHDQQNFAAADGCNACVCMGSMGVVCTTNPCTGGTTQPPFSATPLHTGG